MAIPKKCKAAMAKSKGAKLEIVEIDVPTPKEGEVLVKVHTSGVCHSDSLAIEGMMGPIDWPLIPGHETVGTIVALGPGVKNNLKEGMLVGGAWAGGWDGTCRSCRRGLFQCCENGAVNGVSRVGGYAEYTTLRSEAAVILPENMDKALMAPLMCAGVTVFNGIRNMSIQPGGIVAIQGLGGLGHLAVQYSRKMGYRTVVLSSSGSKEKFAKDLGATDYVDGSKSSAQEQLNEMGGADLIVITAPNPELITPLTSALAPQGKLLILAPVGDVPVNSVSMITKATSIHGWPSGHNLDTQEAIEFAQRFDVNCMIEKFPLDKAQEALEHMTSGKVRFRGVLVMD
ncbi:alcohol dehydrogenase [Microthyrium microscopicum]|uniref:Alcohol dehydrogenase n=1 Tax=Microthyrium microscopicum TaxID=703497 RepID=A0A6A6UEK6_9PEZI|nr:alcohol dehydrogenase [Microthyrium microscopicum]